MNRINLKRIAALSMACMVTTALFTGCGSKDSDPYAAVEYNIEDYVKLGEYTGLNVDEEITIVTDKDIQDAIDSLVEEKTTYKEITDRNAQTGDKVSVSYIRTVEGGSPEESKTESFEIGSGDMGEDFENNMINLNLNGTKTFTVEELDESEPEDAEEDETEETTESGEDAESAENDAEEPEEVKTVNVTYEVTLTKIEEKIVPEVTDAFIAENSESKTLDEYKAAKRTELEDNNAAEAKEKAEHDLLDLVVEASTVDNAPSFLYNINYNSIAQNYEMYAGYFGMSLKEYLSACGMTMDDIKMDAVEATKEILVAEALVKKLGIDLTDEEYQKKLESYVEEYGWDSVEAIQESLSKEQLLMEMRKEKAIDYLYENSTVNKVKVSGDTE